MANSRCATCKHFGQLNNGQDQVTICEANGPQVFATVIVVEGQARWVTQTAWPGVTAVNGCPQHAPNIQLAN